MHQSRTRYVGMDVHQDAMAVAYAPTNTTLRSSTSAASVRAHAISTSSSGTCRSKANSWSLSMKRGRFGPGVACEHASEGVQPLLDPLRCWLDQPRAVVGADVLPSNITPCLAVDDAENLLSCPAVQLATSCRNNAQAEARATRDSPTRATKRSLWPIACSAQLGWGAREACSSPCSFGSPSDERSQSI